MKKWIIMLAAAVFMPLLAAASCADVSTPTPINCVSSITHRQSLLSKPKCIGQW